ncbi:hypothetical protein AB0L79_38440 [Streptomyces tendae]
MTDSWCALRSRPRAFDAEAALEKAMVVFWRQGCEGASLATLTEAMGISRKSRYVAFGNKKSSSSERRCSAARKAPAQRRPGVARTHRPRGGHGVPRWLGASPHPARMSTGCLGVQGALAVDETGQDARDTLTE